MRIRLLAGCALQLAGIIIAVVQGHPLAALLFVYAGFVVQNVRKFDKLFNTGTSKEPSSTQYIVQCKGESGWFDLIVQKHPRVRALKFPGYKHAKEQLDTLLQTREPEETENLRIVRRTTLEEVV